MKFRWWWIIVALASLWLCGWFLSTIILLFFDPELRLEDKRGNLRERFMASCFINWFLWPLLLPAVLERRKLHHDMRTGKRPSWITLDRSRGEQSGRQWKLSDGTEFGASAFSGGDSSDPVDISCDYEDESLTAEVQYRLRMIAPSPEAPTDWVSLTFAPRGRQPDPED